MKFKVASSILCLTGIILLSFLCHPLSAQKLPKNMHFTPDSLRLVTGGVQSKGLYDEKKLDSIYLEFSEPHFWDSLLKNHEKGVDLKATLKMNGRIYDGVGVRFKGMTSFMMTGNSRKKSFNISVDFTHDSLKLSGFKTLNLNNGSEDPTMLREVLYQNLIRNYVPATKGNFVRLYINNEYWGVYSNIQQINSDFIREWFLSDKGSRWRAFNDDGFPKMGPGGPDGGPGKGPLGRPFGPPDSAIRAKIDSMFPNGGPGMAGRMDKEMRERLDSLFKANGLRGGMPPFGPGGPPGPAGRRGLGGPGGPGGLGGPGGGMFGDGKSGLNYLGADTAVYQKSYTLKSGKQPNPWQELIRVTEVLNKTPIDRLEDSISKYMDIDRTLWMLACENVFLDDDGYVFKGGMDYYLYYETETGRMVTIQYDGNATMNAENTGWSPFMNEDRENYPLLNRVLKVPALRQRYLAHMRTIIEESLDTSRLDSLIDGYAGLIRDAIKEDTIKLYTTKAFEEGIPELKEFADKRKTFLMNHEEVSKNGVQIGPVQYHCQTAGSRTASGDTPVRISVQMNPSNMPKQINLWYSTGLVGRFTKMKMTDDGNNGDPAPGDGTYCALIPAYTKGTVVRYYIEAIAGNTSDTATYSPAGAEHDVYVFKVK